MAVTIRGRTLPLPILQGGMGVGISLEHLAGAVAGLRRHGDPLHRPSAAFRSRISPSIPLKPTSGP